MKHKAKNTEKIKKIIVITFINIFSLFFFAVITELLLAYKDYIHFKNNNVEIELRNKYHFSNHLFERYKKNKLYYEDDLRQPSGLEYINKNPLKGSIILLGCSFTYGSDLKYDETFGYLLSKYTKRPVFNLGIPGGGPREMLYLVRTNKIIDLSQKEKNNVDYIIYTYIWDHQIRLYANLRPLVPKYKKTKYNTLVEQKLHFYNKSFIYNSLTRFKFFNYDINNSFNLLNTYISEINKEICNKFNYQKTPPKFIVLVYTDNINENGWEDLKKEKNITIINVKDLTGKDLNNNKEYLTFSDHPNAKAWDVIVPALVKKLNI